MTVRRFANWPPARAGLLLLSLLGLILHGLSLSLPSLPRTTTPAEAGIPIQGDVALYRAVVGRLRAGEPFYAAAGDEQHRRGYATTPFLTWRLPTSAWLISVLGETKVAHLLRLLAGMTILAWMLALRTAGMGMTGGVLGALLLFSGLFLALSTPLVYMHEIWAGTLMALSLALQPRCWPLSVGFGLGALAIRELALPFVLIMALSAWWDGRGREALWWSLGLLAFALALGLHAWMVATQIPPDARAGGGWLALGGWSFVLSLNHWNLFIPAGAGWLSAIWLPLSLIGAAATRGPLANRLFLIQAGYFLAFLFVGRPNNDYWGILLLPLVAVSLVFAPGAILDLVKRLRSRPSPSG